MDFQYKIMWIAEKQSQAEKYSKAFANAKKGYIKKDDIGNFFVCSDPEYCNGTKVIITWASGHLLELAEPDEYDERYKVWSRETLPIIPDEFSYKVNLNNKRQLRVVDYFMKMCDTIVWAGDLDREGSHISYLLSVYSGVWGSSNKTFKRLWVKDLLPKTIKKGFKNLQPIDHSYQQALAGQARAKADWLIGMNGTRFISLILNELGFSTPLPKTVGGVSVGRVMTPTLFLVYNREREIETFKPRTYYTLSAVFQHPNGQYEGKLIVPDITMKNGKKWNGELDTEEQWRTFLARYAPSFSEGVVADKTSETKYTRSPRLFTLNDLQQVMNKKIGISPDKTLSIVQSLYDPKGNKKGDNDSKEVSPDAYLTYPRSESEYITDEEYKEMLPTVPTMADWLGISHDLLVINEKPDGFYVNTKICGERGHSAITPTANFPTKEIYNSWDSETQAVYLEVLKRTFAMFLPKYEYQENIIITKVEKLDFKTVGKTPINQGWKILWNDEKKENKEKELVAVMVNDQVKATPVVSNTTTKPPALYSEGTLLAAMKTAGTKVPEDVETDEEVEELAKIMRSINGIGTPATRADTIKKLFDKKQIVKVKGKVKTTPLGRLICRILENEIIFSNPQVTAKWELSLNRIEEGANNPDQFITNIKRYLGVGSPEKNLFVNVDKWKASLSLDEFNDLKKEINKKRDPIIEDTRVSCPLCMKRLKYFDEFIICEDNKRDSEGHQVGCEFILSNYVGRYKKTSSKGKISWVGGKKLTEKQIIALHAKEEVMVKGIKGKKNKYDAPVILDYNSETGRFYYKLNFKPKAEAVVVGSCPKCHGQVKLHDKVASCEYNKPKGGACDFVIFRSTCGTELSETDIRELLSDGKTSTIKDGLYSGKGKPKTRGYLIRTADNKVAVQAQ